MDQSQRIHETKFNFKVTLQPVNIRLINHQIFDPFHLDKMWQVFETWKQCLTYKKYYFCLLFRLHSYLNERKFVERKNSQMIPTIFCQLRLCPIYILTKAGRKWKEGERNISSHSFFSLFALFCWHFLSYTENCQRSFIFKRRTNTFNAHSHITMLSSDLTWDGTYTNNPKRGREKEKNDDDNDVVNRNVYVERWHGPNDVVEPPIHFLRCTSSWAFFYRSLCEWICRKLFAIKNCYLCADACSSSLATVRLHASDLVLTFECMHHICHGLQHAWRSFSSIKLMF